MHEIYDPIHMKTAQMPCISYAKTKYNSSTSQYRKILDNVN